MGKTDKKKQTLLQQLLAAYLQEDLPAAEKEKIENWLEEKPKHNNLGEEDYTRIEKEIFHHVASHIRIPSVSEQAPTPTPKIKRWWYYAAAAVVLIGSFVGVYVKYQTNDAPNIAKQPEPVFQTITTKSGQRGKISLPDSTVVYLHGNTVLRYNAYYAAQPERRVFLDQGEAFFEVVHDSEKPFVVQTAYAENTVLGTSFNIQLLGDDGRYHLSVNTGRVGFRPLTGDSTMQVVEKGKQLIFDLQNGTTELAKAQTERLSSWKDNVLLLSDNNWEEVKKRLEIWFDVKVYVDPRKVKSQYFTASFKQPRLKEILEGLQNINYFKYRIDGKEVFIE